MACVYCRPSDIVTDGATISLTSGSADSAFPLANLYDRAAHTVFKSTGTGCTIRAVFGGAKTLQAIAFINHKLAGATVSVTNGAGFSTTVTIPATPEDGHPLDAWKTFIGLANASSTTWDIAITGAATVVVIGELLLVETLRTLPILWGAIQSETHQAITQVTDYGLRRKYSMGVRQRRVRGSVHKEVYRSDVLSLARDARGAFKNFLLVLEDDVNDALFVDLATDTRDITRAVDTVSEVDLEFIEAQKGLSL